MYVFFHCSIVYRGPRRLVVIIKRDLGSPPRASNTCHCVIDRILGFPLLPARTTPITRRVSFEFFHLHPCYYANLRYPVIDNRK